MKLCENIFLSMNPSKFHLNIVLRLCIILDDLAYSILHTPLMCSIRISYNLFTDIKLNDIIQSKT